MQVGFVVKIRRFVIVDVSEDEYAALLAGIDGDWLDVTEAIDGLVANKVHSIDNWNDLPNDVRQPISDSLLDVRLEVAAQSGEFSFTRDTYELATKDDIKFAMYDWQDDVPKTAAGQEAFDNAPV